MAAAIAAALAIAALPAAAATPNDGQLGGPPEGVVDDTICPGGEAVTDVTGFTRTIGINIRIVAVATLQCAGGGLASTMGSATGSVDELPGGTSCAPGLVAVGIVGREGDFVDNLFLRCALPDGSGPITPSVPLFGGLGGQPDGPYDCPAGQVLTGLTGMSVFSSTTIRYVEIVCVPAPPVCPPNGDDDNDGLTNTNESLFFTLLDDDDSDDDGIRDGNDDGDDDGEDDEDEDDDEGDGCPDEDSDDDGEDDEDEDDEEDDD